VVFRITRLAGKGQPMSETKHTKGPWSQYGIAITANRKDVCWMGVPAQYPGDSARMCKNDKANAHLIAAAPDLLAACERQLANIERWLETGVPAGPEESKAIYEQMKKAAEKAKGVE